MLTSLRWRQSLVIGLVVFFLGGCSALSLTLEGDTHQTEPTLEIPMIDSFVITEIQINQTNYQPGDTVSVTVGLEVQSEDNFLVQMQAVVKHLVNEIEVIERKLEVPSGITSFEISYTPPPNAPRGYGMDICLSLEDGTQLACESIAFDVLDHWTQTPRYGFLVDFSPNKTDIDETIAALSRYHINGLQFYDWMYRHDQFLPKEDPFRDPLGRLLSLKTVKELITAAHVYNIAAMPYTAIYASSDAFYQDHKEWALYQANGEPFRLGDNFLVYMDPRPDSPWVTHLMDQFNQVLNETEFDGIHLDQYGDPKAAQDARGLSFALDEPIAASINLTKQLALTHNSNHAVIFNAVNNWPIEAVAPSEQDFVYIEVWPPHIWYQDLHNLIVNAQVLGEGKPVVLAAYIDPEFEHTARLLNAVIFASGGGHIELGERNAMLADPYFPNFKVMSPELAAAMEYYYDFTVRYQDVIGPRTLDAKGEIKVSVEGAATEPKLQKNKVWPILRKGEGFLAVNLINFLDINSPVWTEEISSPPRELGITKVTIRNLSQHVERIWFATPDQSNVSATQLQFSEFEDEKGIGVTIQIPSLAYWGLIVIEWSN